MDHKLYIQQVTVYWTKESRGIPGATLRNRCPESFRLTVAECEALTLDKGYSVIAMREWEKFVPTRQIEPYRYEGKKDFGSVSIKQPQKEAMIVRYEYINYLVGAPDRSSRPAISCEIKPGELVRVKHNGRFSEPYDEWHYHLHVYNIVFTDKITREMFTVEPSHHITDMADLL